jgi:hypothetical protein
MMICDKFKINRIQHAGVISENEKCSSLYIAMSKTGGGEWLSRRLYRKAENDKRCTCLKLCRCPIVVFPPRHFLLRKTDYIAISCGIF